MRKLTKLFNTKAISIDETSKTIRFKISDNQADRMGEVVDQETWDFKNYLNNPIVLWGHNPDEPENVLGTTLALDTQDGATYADMTFDDDINPKAGLVWKQLLKGTLRTVSVGFISHDIQGNVLKNNELLEISVVPIPANPRAFALSYKAGEMSRKDATYLMNSMKSEMDYIEQQLEAGQEDGTLKEKDVDELKQQIAQMIELLGKQGEQIAALNDTVAALQKADETEDEATDDDTEEGADTSPDEATDQETDTNDEDDSAKGGETDQSGAETDDIDLGAELTPELEAQLESQLATEDQAA